MSEDANGKQALLDKVVAKRTKIKAFLVKAGPRHTRLVNLAIISSALAAALTAGPAFGGQTVTAWFTQTLGLTAPAWQLLCLGATFFSLAAAIVTNITKSHGVAANLLQAQATDARLEGLQTLIELDQIEIKKASSLYVQYLGDIPFL